MRKESPAVRAEDTRQQTYAYRGVADAIARETNNSRPYFSDTAHSSPHIAQDDIPQSSGPHPRRPANLFPSEEWSQGKNGTLDGLNPFTDSEKINAINKANNRHLDTEMADQSTNSRGLTPQSSSGYNPSSSNASYSSSQAHDNDQNVSGTGGGGRFMTGFTPQPQTTLAQQQEDPFKVPAGWDMGTGLTPGQGMTPGNLAGMTPDGGWEKLMDSMGWETGRTV